MQGRRGENVSYYCVTYSIEINPEETEVRSKSRLTTPEGINQTPYVAYPPEPDLRRKKTEIKGGLAELQKRGIKVTSYTESKG